MKNKNYQVIKGAVSKDISQLLTDYALLKAKIKHKSRKSDLLANVHREYGDPLMEVLLERLQPLVEKETGLQLWPTLSFYYHYQNGNQLEKHKDRVSCEVVAGLCLGADDDFLKEKGSWPLILDNNGQEEKVYLNEGDLIIFRGHETTHWREPFEGQWFVSAIFAYVDKNGPWAFLKYDQRKQLGKAHVGMFRWSFGLLRKYFRRK